VSRQHFYDIKRAYAEGGTDTFSPVAFGKLYDTRTPITAVHCLNDRVLRVLTDRGAEYSGRDDRHPYQLFLGLNEIEHTRTKARRPQTNGIYERFHQTCLNEFYKVQFRKNKSTTPLTSCRQIWILGWNTTTGN